MGRLYRIGEGNDGMKVIGHYDMLANGNAGKNIRNGCQRFLHNSASWRQANHTAFNRTQTRRITFCTNSNEIMSVGTVILTV